MLVLFSETVGHTIRIFKQLRKRRRKKKIVNEKKQMNQKRETR